MTQTLEFRVTGEQQIRCAGCEQRIRNALRRLPGIHKVEASAQAQRVSLTLDPAQVSPEQVQQKLKQLGYEVTQQGNTP